MDLFPIIIAFVIAYSLLFVIPHKLDQVIQRLDKLADLLEKKNTSD